MSQASAEGTPFDAVGRLNLGGSEYCTATLIDEQFVVTAAHCVVSETGTPRALEGLSFQAGLSGKTARAVRKVRRVLMPRDFSGDMQELANLARDVALLVLDTPVSRQKIAPLRVAPSDGQIFGFASYSGQRSTRLTVTEGCETAQRSQGALLLSCEAERGASGAPVFDHDGAGQMRLVSLITAEARLGGMSVLIGSDLPAALADFLAELHGDRVESSEVAMVPGLVPDPVSRAH
ncbi:trypsin-like serine peptidase [Palleronia caenipelagi]|nr:trypsin-like peptidase domain-containing protein [Palleronia caenipelagi]